MFHGACVTMFDVYFVGRPENVGSVSTIVQVSIVTSVYQTIMVMHWLRKKETVRVCGVS